MLFRFWSLDLDHRVNFFSLSLYFFLFLTFHLLSLSFFFFSPSTSFLCLLSCCCFIASSHYLLALPYALHATSRICCLVASCICCLVASHICRLITSHAHCFIASCVDLLHHYLIVSSPWYFFHTTSMPLLRCLITLPFHLVTLPCCLITQLCYFMCCLSTSLPCLVTIVCCLATSRYLLTPPICCFMGSCLATSLPCCFTTLLVGTSFLPLLLQGGSWSLEKRVFQQPLEN